MALAVTGLRFLVGFVFLTASVPKLIARRDFKLAVGNYRLLPRSLVGPVAALLPALELACAAALLAGAALPVVAVCVALLLTAFSAAAAVNLIRGRKIDCGCAGLGAPRRIGWLLVARNVILIVASALIAVAPPKSASSVVVHWPTAASGSPTSGEVGAVAMTAALAVLIVSVLTEAIRLRAAAQGFSSKAA